MLKITEENFEQEVLNSDKPVLIDFFAQWCPPCKKLSPIVEQLAEERGDVKICKTDTDEEPRIAAQFGVQSIPTLILFKNGEPTDVAVGYMSREDLTNMLDKSLKV